MANDPRKFIISDCGRGPQRSVNETHARRQFADTLGKIGDIEAFNSVPGASGIAQGLRTISGVSNSIRDGEGGPSGLLGIGNFLGGSLDAGAGWVLDNVGIASSAIESVSKFNPGVANRAFDQAKNVFDKTRNGDFNLSDIPSALQDLQNLDILANNIFTPSAESEKKTATCYASPYAESLAYEFAPKSPFLFIVELVFNADQISHPDDPKTTAHLIKTSTRPNVRFEYEEVNMYNFRTKVVKRSEFEPMIMTFHDDQKDSVLFTFYQEYLNRMAPITNLDPSVQSATYEESGMRFGNQSSASIGVLSNNKKTILSEIKLYHITNYGKTIDVYHFANPKIEEMQLSDLDMATSEPTQVQIQFVYDGLYIEPNQSLDSPKINVTELTNFGKWPIKYDGSANSSGSSEGGGFRSEGLSEEELENLTGGTDL